VRREFELLSVELVDAERSASAKISRLRWMSVMKSDETKMDNNVIFRGLSVRMGGHWGEPVCAKDPVTSRMDYFRPLSFKKLVLTVETPQQGSRRG
jgi:hypothetical protein